MTDFKNSHIIIAATLLFLLMGMSFLAYSETTQQNYDYGGNLWVVFFADPKSDNMSFSIENHTSNTSFHWQEVVAKDIIAQGDVTVGIGKTVDVQIAPYAFTGKKAVIKVTSGKSEKDIYKIF